jgi:hypothetical protein
MGMASRKSRPMTHIAIVEQLEGKSAEYLRRELTPLPVGHRRSPPPRFHDANENVCDTIGCSCCDKSAITGCSIKGGRSRFEGYPHEQRASNLREAEVDESCSTCDVASSDGSVRKRVPWIIPFRTKKETDCCTLDITSSNHVSLASLAVTDRSQRDDPGSVQPRSPLRFSPIVELGRSLAVRWSGTALLVTQSPGCCVCAEV